MSYLPVFFLGKSSKEAITQPGSELIQGAERHLVKALLVEDFIEELMVVDYHDMLTWGAVSENGTIRISKACVAGLNRVWVKAMNVSEIVGWKFWNVGHVTVNALTVSWRIKSANL